MLALTDIYGKSLRRETGTDPMDKITEDTDRVSPVPITNLSVFSKVFNRWNRFLC